MEIFEEIHPITVLLFFRYSSDAGPRCFVCVGESLPPFDRVNVSKSSLRHRFNFWIRKNPVESQIPAHLRQNSDSSSNRRLQSSGMREESNKKKGVNALNSSRPWTERKTLLRKSELGAWSKMSDFVSFPERIRVTWHTFIWPQPSRRSRRLKDEK